MKSVATYLLFLLCPALYAQDTLWLNDLVKVAAASNEKTMQTGFTDMKYQQGKRLSETLNEFSSVYVKNYGNGQLASLSVRGTSAAQSEILWNGITLNSPVLGQVDLSLFALGMQDELQLIKTGYQGTIGGSLLLKDDAPKDTGISATLTLRAGSFKTFESYGKLQYAKRRISGATRISYLRSDNDFRFRNSTKEGHPWEKQTNAQVRLFSMMQQLNTIINSRNSLAVYLWLNEANREIPPIISKPESKEQQYDYSLRTLATWNGHYHHLNLQMTSAFFHDNIRYQNPDAELDETTLTDALRNRLQISYLFPFGLTLNSTLSYDYELAKVHEYQQLRSRHSLGFRFYTTYYHGSGFKIQAGFREDLTDNQLSAFAPQVQIGYNKDINQQHQLNITLQASRNFRYPTLNDLYWQPGGNPNLKQEKSWNGELGMSYRFLKYLSFRCSTFYILVNDWIQWVPEGIIWHPVNLRRVFSRGAEVNISASTTSQPSPDKFEADFYLAYSYTKATNLQPVSAFDQSDGKQLIYVPEHCLTGGMTLTYKRFYLRNINHLVSRRFTSTDNSQYLPAYFTSDLEVGKEFIAGRTELGLSFGIKNIGGADYQDVAQRPMPGRSFEGTIRWTLL